MFRLEISRILTKFTKNWVKIFMILRQERWNILDHAIWFKSEGSLRVVYNDRGQLKNTDISGALYSLIIQF